MKLKAAKPIKIIAAAVVLLLLLCAFLSISPIRNADDEKKAVFEGCKESFETLNEYVLNYYSTAVTEEKNNIYGLF